MCGRKPWVKIYTHKENRMVEQSFDDGINMEQKPSEEDPSEKKWGIHKTLFNLWNLYAADQ